MQPTYQPVKDFLRSDEHELLLTDSELEELIDRAYRQICFENNVSKDMGRLKHNPREQAFYDEWLKENMPLRGINHGFGILQDLFIDYVKDDPLHRKVWKLEINSRDRMVAATVVQWLGTNCGMSFLNEALKRIGLKITPIESRS